MVGQTSSGMMSPRGGMLILFTAAGGASATLQFPALAVRLDRSNYSLWRGTIRSALEAYELDSFLASGTAPSSTLPPKEGSTDSVPNPAFAIWKRKDRLVLLWLRSTLTSSLLGHVARATTTSEVWLMLEQMFHAQTRARQMHLKQQLQTLAKGSMSILEYVKKKRAISDSLAECLTIVSDEDFVSFLLFGLGPEYGTFKSALSIRIEPITSDDLLGLLLREEQRLEDDNNGASLLSANIATKRPSAGRSSMGLSSAPSIDRPKSICQICSKPYHEARNCHQRLNLALFPATNRKSGDRQRQQQPTNSKQAHIAYGNNPSTLTDPWVVDSGATNHVTADLGNLSIQSEYTGTDNLVVGSGEPLPITHIGQSVLTSKHVSKPLSLNNILVVPKISKNLVSVSQLCKDNNVSIEFDANDCYVKSLQGQRILKGVVENGLLLGFWWTSDQTGCLEILPELLELDPPVMNLTNDLLADQQLRIPEHPNKLRTSFGLIVGVDYEGERERDSLGFYGCGN
ncbi:hypothetical protein OSB04_016558 [Centaurea solstitialis]|uniref:Retrovirus-related Pol polyprotein from transposon TNT 1-94-like beta-barrel domain-containing protein n=1 Tax=Centaurea solstitialis TaxID=347529 RepID=A0AA38T8V5_9ASTR|nr:hypothetical protein OSB04_016558 [Centaurea solstitialis]